MVQEAKGSVRKRERENGKADFAGAVIVNLIVLVLFNLYPVWQPWTAGVITEGWSRILWAANLGFAVQICGNLILLFTSPPWLRRLMELAFSITGLISAAVFYAVFPLDFSPIAGDWLDVLLRVVLLVGIAGAAIGVIESLVRLASSGGGVVGSNRGSATGRT